MNFKGKLQRQISMYRLPLVLLNDKDRHTHLIFNDPVYHHYHNQKIKLLRYRLGYLNVCLHLILSLLCSQLPTSFWVMAHQLRLSESILMHVQVYPYILRPKYKPLRFRLRPYYENSFLL